MTDYVSKIKHIPAPRSLVYSKLSDLRGLSRISEALKHTEAGKVELEVIDADTVAFQVPMAGKLSLKIVEREPEGTIKLEAQQSPLPITLWIQLLELAPADTRLRLTLRTELNFLTKQLVGSKLEEGVEKLADLLASVPYQHLG